jgi:hypothetical protein
MEGSVSRDSSGGVVIRAVVVPALRAGITGLGFGVLGGLGAWGVDYGQDALGVGAFVASLGFVASWLVMLAGPRRTTTVDLSSVGQMTRNTGGPSRLVLVNPRANDEPDRAERFGSFVEAASMDTSTRGLESRGFTRDELDDYRSVLIRTGWAEWRGRDRRAGWQLVAEPEAILGALQ